MRVVTCVVNGAETPGTAVSACALRGMQASHWRLVCFVDTITAVAPVSVAQLPTDMWRHAHASKQRRDKRHASGQTRDCLQYIGVIWAVPLIYFPTKLALFFHFGCFPSFDPNVSNLKLSHAKAAKCHISFFLKNLLLHVSHNQTRCIHHTGVSHCKGTVSSTSHSRHLLFLFLLSVWHYVRSTCTH